MRTEDRNRLEIGFINKISNFWDHSISFNKFHTKLLWVAHSNIHLHILINILHDVTDVISSRTFLIWDQCQKLYHFSSKDNYFSFGNIRRDFGSIKPVYKTFKILIHSFVYFFYWLLIDFIGQVGGTSKMKDYGVFDSKI